MFGRSLSSSLAALALGLTAAMSAFGSPPAFPAPRSPGLKKAGKVYPFQSDRQRARYKRQMEAGILKPN